MWPDSKGKGGKEGSPKSKDGGGDSNKPNAGASGSSSGGSGKGKGRNTKTKMKAMQALQPPVDPAQASAQLEQEILKAAQNISQGEGKSEETKTLIEINRVPDEAVRSGAGETGTSANLMRLPEASNENIDDKISSLWKSRVLGAYRANPRASQHILPAMPNNRGALEITDKAKCDAQQTAMISLVDKMFDSFQNLAFEFNAMAQASDLELTWIRPTISRENISSWHQAAQVISVFTGRISTRKWTMVVRGTFDVVVAYTVPADKLLAFTNQPSNFHPIIELFPVADGLTVRWNVFGRSVSQEDLGNIYRALLDNMIRIAQDDAPCDQFIDLGAYGVVLGGALTSNDQAGQAAGPVMGQDINYSAKYQQQFYKEDATSAELPRVPSLEPQQSADWKPVVHTVRGANPPVPPTPMPGQAGASEPGALPSTPGFNQDEPWKYAAPPAGGQSNPSINSYARPGAGIAAAAGAQRNIPGDQNDEPPLPSLPAHLFEGLPPRPGVNAGQNAGDVPGPSMSQSSPSSFQGQPSPWAAPPSNMGTSTNTSTPAVSQSSSDGWKTADVADGGWKSAGIPAAKVTPSLPPLPVSPYQGSKDGSFINEPSPMGNSLSAADSFTSGSIRVDALAREIAHSQVNLPPAVPGFEPYSVAESAVQARLQNAAQQSGLPPPFPLSGSSPSFLSAGAPPPTAPPVQATSSTSYSSFGRPNHIPEDSSLASEDEFPDEYANDNKPWPKARPRVIEETDDHDPIDADPIYPEPSKASTFSSSSTSNSSIANSSIPSFSSSSSSPNIPASPTPSFSQLRIDPRLEALPSVQPFQPMAQPSPSDSVEGNAFINFESEAEVMAPPAENSIASNVEDSEIAALFEGEPVNSGERKDNAGSARTASAGPAYMAWLEPEPTPESNPGSTTESTPESALEAVGYGQSAAPVGEASYQALSLSPSPSFSPSIPEAPVSTGEKPSIGKDARAAIEEGFRQAQAIVASQVNMDAVPSSRVAPDFPVSFDAPADAASEVPSPSVPDFSAVGFSDVSTETTSAQAEAGAPESYQVTSEGAYDNNALDSVATSAPGAAESYFENPAESAVISSPESSSAAAPAGPRSLKADIERLLVNLDSELEVISNRGSEAFAKRDLKSAERMIKLAETLSEFKESLTKLKDEHGQDLS